MGKSVPVMFSSRNGSKAMDRECTFCNGSADFLWFDDDGQWFVCSECIKEGKTDAELCDECGAPHEDDVEVIA